VISFSLLLPSICANSSAVGDGGVYIISGFCVAKSSAVLMSSFARLRFRYGASTASRPSLMYGSVGCLLSISSLVGSASVCLSVVPCSSIYLFGPCGGGMRRIVATGTRVAVAEARRASSAGVLPESERRRLFGGLVECVATANAAVKSQYMLIGGGSSESLLRCELSVKHYPEWLRDIRTYFRLATAHS
jgi:hypothetical protein